MSAFQDLASPAPIVEEAKVQAAEESGAVKVEAAEVVEEPTIEAAPAVSGAITGDYKKFAPKVEPTKPSLLSVAELKKQGTEFESEAGVIKGGVEKDTLKRFLPLFFDERDFVSYGEVRRYIFVRGAFIFVYGEKNDPTPLYVVDISNFKATIENPKKPDKYSFTISPQAGTNKSESYFTTVLLKDKKSKKQAYQFTFDTRNDKSLIKRFMDVLSLNAQKFQGKVVSASVVEDKMGGKGSRSKK